MEREIIIQRTVAFLRVLRGLLGLSATAIAGNGREGAARASQGLVQRGVAAGIAAL